MKYNQVTWYSRLGALILFLFVVPVLCFYIGTQYQATKDLYDDLQPVSSKSGTPMQNPMHSKLPAGEAKAFKVISVAPNPIVSGSIISVQGRGFTSVSVLRFYQNGVLLGSIGNPTEVASAGVAVKFVFSPDFYLQSLKAKPGVYQVAVANGVEVTNMVNLKVK